MPPEKEQVKKKVTVKVHSYADYLQKAQAQVGQESSWNRAHELLFEEQLALGRKFICTASKGGETRFIFADA